MMARPRVIGVGRKEDLRCNYSTIGCTKAYKRLYSLGRFCGATKYAVVTQVLVEKNPVRVDTDKEVKPYE